jgi:hypothetical protein
MRRALPLVRTRFFRHQNSIDFLRSRTIEREHDYPFTQRMHGNIAVIFRFTEDHPVIPQAISRKRDSCNDNYRSVDPVNTYLVVVFLSYWSRKVDTR